MAVGLVSVCGLNPAAMLSTKMAAAAAAAGIAVIAARTARRPTLIARQGNTGPVPSSVTQA